MPRTRFDDRAVGPKQRMTRDGSEDATANDDGHAEDDTAEEALVPGNASASGLDEARHHLRQQSHPQRRDDEQRDGERPAVAIQRPVLPARLAAEPAAAPSTAKAAQDSRSEATAARRCAATDATPAPAISRPPRIVTRGSRRR